MRIDWRYLAGYATQHEEVVVECAPHAQEWAAEALLRWRSGG